MNAGLLLINTLTPSNAVGALFPLKSGGSHSRELPARLEPVISKYDPAVNEFNPPNPRADCTLVITGRLRMQTGAAVTRATIVPSPRAVMANGFAVPFASPWWNGTDACPSMRRAK